jgi:hypothetical protein
MYKFGTFFGVKVMSSAPRDGAFINCDVSFVCVCVCVCVCVLCVIVMLGYFHLQNFTWILLTMPILQKPYVYNAPCLSPFLQKTMSTFPWLSSLWKSLCSRALALSTILQKPLLTFFD